MYLVRQEQGREGREGWAGQQQATDLRGFRLSVDSAEKGVFHQLRWSDREGKCASQAGAEQPGQVKWVGKAC